MPKIISEQQIIEAAIALLAKGHNPTLAAVRKHLGCRGSLSTVHKYLSKWKEGCYRQAVNTVTSFKTDNNAEEEKKILKQTLTKQISQNEYYASELINAEKKLIKLTADNQQLQTSNQHLQLELKDRQTAEDLYQVLKSEIDLNKCHTINKQQQIIDQLRAEIQEINATSVLAMRETSTNSHELLMQSKVEVINLQAKIDSLQKQLAETKEQWYLALARVQSNSQQRVDVEQLKQLEEQQIQVTIRSKVGKSCGE